MDDLQKLTQKSTGKKNSSISFIIIGLAVIGIIVMMAAWMKKSTVQRLVIGEKTPDFEIISFSGKTYKLSELKGKVVLVNVWASWCVTCDDESYMLQTVWNEMSTTEDIAFIGVDYVDTEKPALDFIEKHGITYPNGPDVSSRISKLFRITGVPESFLIDKNGILKAIQIGPFSSAEDVSDFLSNAD